MREPWDFDYAPLHTYADDQPAEDDLVLATSSDADPASIANSLGHLAETISVRPLLRLRPLFWFRLQFSQPLAPERVRQALSDSGIAVRYVTSARYGTQSLGPALDFQQALPRRPGDWRTRPEQPTVDQSTPGHWFLGKDGLSIERSVCGFGAGTRLAVIDHDGRDADKLDLDAEIAIDVEQVPRGAAHTALMIGWAVGARWDNGKFVGVAPCASPRFYRIPKTELDVVHLPLALVRAADDGADVIVCATYTNGQQSPMLDDALEFVTRLGREGRGSVVVFPASREMSSPPDSVHASLSLGMAEPASDPRVFCVGASGADGGWFLWRDKKGRLHPFSNRGPALRWLAPGDDLGYPLGPRGTLVHGESSAASAMASGALLLLLGKNPHLSLNEIDDVMQLTAEAVWPGQERLADLADPHDLLPSGVDPDAHNAKHGYGRLSAGLACVAVQNPLASALIAVGQRELGLSLQRAVTCGTIGLPASSSLLQWLARVFLDDAGFRHALCAAARMLRLWIAHPRRAEQQPAGTLLRHFALALRSAEVRTDIPHDVADELTVLARKIRALTRDPVQARAVEERLYSALAGQERDLGQTPKALSISSQRGWTEGERLANDRPQARL